MNYRSPLGFVVHLAVRASSAFTLHTALDLLRGRIATFVAILFYGGAALAQTPAAYPVFPAVDGLGVNIATGDFNYSQTDVFIGQPEAGGLGFSLSHLSGANSFWTHNHIGYVSSGGSSCTVAIGTFTETFTSSGNGCFASLSSDQQRGASLSYNSSNATFTFVSSGGTVAVFYGWSGAIGFQGFPSSAVGYLGSITTPTGEVTNYNYSFGAPICYPDPEYCYITYSFARLGSVTNNVGYQLLLHYPGAPESGLPPDKVTGVNTAVEFCTDYSCSSTWPSATYSYDGSNRPVSVTNALGETTGITYTGSLLSKIQFPDNTSHNINIAYTSGRVSSVGLGFGSWSYGYSDASGTRTTTVTNPDSTTRAYGSTIATGRVTSVRNEANQTVSYQFDGAARETRVTQPAGNYVQYTLDGRGNATETRFVSKTPGTLADIVLTATYPSYCAYPTTCNKPTTTTDALGYRTDYTYDNTHGGLTKVTAPAPSGSAPVGSGARPETRISYGQFQARYKNSLSTYVNSAPIWRRTATATCDTAAPGCIGTTSEALVSVAYPSSSVPNNLLPTSVTRSAGNGSLAATTSMTYTNASDLNTVDGALSGTADTTRNYYDAGRRLTGTVGPDPDGAGSLLYRATRTTYNAIGQPTVVERGTVTSQGDTAFASFVVLQKQTTEYDSYGRPVAAKLWSGASIAALTQANYDNRGRLSCTASRMNSALFSSPPSDACALGTSGSYGSDRISRNVYDAVGRLYQQQSAVGTGLAQNTATYSYTANGLVSTLTNARGYMTSYYYDGFDRFTKREYPNPTTTNSSSTSDYESLTYDAYGRVAQERRRSGDVFGFSYDNLGRMTLRDAPGTQPDVSYSYDLMSRVTSESQSGNVVSRAYNALSQLTSETSSVLGSVSYGYDVAGRRSQLTYPGGFYVTYGYNTRGDLTGIYENGAASLATYAYDDLGRRVSLTRGTGATTTFAFDGASRLGTLTLDTAGTSHDTTFGLTYSPANQLTSRTRTNAAFDWVLPASASESYSADGLDRYTSALGVSPAYDTRGNLTGDGTKTYSYDADNRMTSASGGVTLGYDPMGRLHQVSGSATTRFLYDGADVIAEYDAGGTALRRYVHGPGSDEPIAWYEGSGFSDKRFLISDERGSVIGTTNTSGTVTQVSAYDAYGTPGATNQGRFQYTGQMWISEIGLYYYKAREYHPRLGRFMQTDPIGVTGGLNLYAYVGGDPVNLVDPTGLADDCPNVLGTADIRESCVNGNRVTPPGGGGGGGGGGGRGSNANYPNGTSEQWQAWCQETGNCKASQSACPKPTGNQTSPWHLGWEWLTGTGPRSRNFSDGDTFTELLRGHRNIQNLVSAARSGSIPSTGQWDYSVGGVDGVGLYLQDYSNLLTGGRTGNLAVTFLGSYDVAYSINGNTLSVHITNSSTIQSATHPPIVGYTDWWGRNIGDRLDSAFSSGPMSKTTQQINMTFDLSGACP